MNIVYNDEGLLEIYVADIRRKVTFESFDEAYNYKLEHEE